jgi:hypothetical protein
MAEEGFEYATTTNLRVPWAEGDTEMVHGSQIVRVYPYPDGRGLFSWHHFDDGRESTTWVRPRRLRWDAWWMNSLCRCCEG